MLRFLKDMLYLGGFIFWFCVICFLAMAIVMVVWERKQKRGSESDS
jgi:hypothetical protein